MYWKGGLASLWRAGYRMPRPCSVLVATSVAESTGEDEMLRYLDDAERANADAKYWSEAYGSKVLYERARARVFVDGRRVETPYGFRVGVKAPRGKRQRFPVEVEAISEDALRDLLLHALEGERRKGREVTVEHEVDGTVALYRVRGENAAGFACELVSGEPRIFRQGKRVELARPSSLPVLDGENDGEIEELLLVPALRARRTELRVGSEGRSELPLPGLRRGLPR